MLAGYMSPQSTSVSGSGHPQSAFFRIPFLREILLWLPANFQGLKLVALIYIKQIYRQQELLNEVNGN
jgi:hypothetical protein